MVRPLLRVQAPDQVDDLDLMSDVEKRGWLVQKQ
ncbi:MAG: hypothetical protein KatS3mg059_0947 [Thermomicrobiales bacterium]|nr:MAG: hypothetical protein KatS3mg059_0947 [Thermomicrobiales bacterium]